MKNENLIDIEGKTVGEIIATVLKESKDGNVSVPGSGLPEGTFVCTVNKCEIVESANMKSKGIEYKYCRLTCDLKLQGKKEVFKNRAVNINATFVDALKGSEGQTFQMTVKRVKGEQYPNYTFEAVED